MAKLSPQGIFRAFDDTGAPLAGGKVYTYVAGTSTPKNTYTDEGGLTPLSNPVILDVNGYAKIWLESGAYKFVVDSSTDVEQYTEDNIIGDSTGGYASTYLSVSGNTTITTAHKNNFIVATASMTFSLLAAATADEGFLFTVKNNSTGDVTIDPDGSETIDGQTTVLISAGASADIICTGTAWETSSNANSSHYDVDTGAADAYVVEIAPEPQAYYAGLSITFKAANANTGASTVNVNGLGTKSIKKNTSSALESGDIVQDQLVSATYDGTDFQIVQLPASAYTTLVVNKDMTGLSAFDIDISDGSAEDYYIVTFNNMIMTASTEPSVQVGLEDSGASAINITDMGYRQKGNLGTITQSDTASTGATLSIVGHVSGTVVSGTMTLLGAHNSSANAIGLSEAASINATDTNMGGVRRFIAEATTNVDTLVIEIGGGGSPSTTSGFIKVERVTG